MTDITKVTLVQSMTDETDYDVISAFLEMAGDALCHYVDPFQMKEKSDLLETYGGVQTRIAAVWLNKRGADGQLSHSENGISRSYESGDIPSSILQELTPICGVVK